LAPAMPERCSGGWAYRRRCTVTVFGLRAVHAAEDGTPFESGLEPDSPQFRRLERAAVKALYAQGLDFGQVLLQAGNAGWEIARITELPDLSAPDAARLFAGAVLQTARDWAAAQAAADRTAQNAEKRAAERELPPDGLGGGLPGKWAARGHEQGKEKGQEQADNALLIGMDPEFLLFDQSARKIIPASRFLQTSGRAGADSVRIQGRRRFVLAELRPEPAGEPREAVLRLMAAMREASSRIADKSLQWLAGGLPQPGLPLGGHLHFSGVLLTPQLLRALDHFLAIPIAVLEDRRSASRRPRYGCLGDFRRQSHGGFEYRTLPSFLVSPSVTKGAVALALLVAAEYKAGRLPEVPPVPEAALKAFYTGNREALRPFALKALEAAESLASYESFQAYIAPMFQAVREGRTWDESRDIRRAWRLTAASEGQAD
ncbi:putative amidoligase domain-containing protein, partial [Paenibacillus pinistramenti]|uniref:putative amidoligase domain-containing protein n=1 Tax=Paenibacillus pinistramenti TaxID=1768003 RepID=UPI0011086A17